jgi:hypothetical protein
MPYTVNVDWLDVSKFPETSETISILLDHPYFQRPHDDTTTRYIAIQCEPEAIVHSRQAFINNHQVFDVILSYDDEILKSCPNAVMYIWGTSWISSDVYNAIDITIKEHKISAITGTKEMTPAHTFRKSLYMSQTLLSSIPITWFRSCKGTPLVNIRSNPILGNSKNPLFLTYRFSLVIENSKQNNYFSEKLIDCLITKTIPIYFGCPNISNWFDIRGWIILDSMSIQDFTSRCSRLPDYAAHINAINENFERAKQYASLEKNIQRAMNFGVATRASGD